jgi:hypothetical protein
MFIKAVIKTLLNESSRLTGPAQLYMNSTLVNPFVVNTFLSARAKSSGVKAIFQSSHEAPRCECMHEHFHPITMRTQSEMTNEVALGFMWFGLVWFGLVWFGLVCLSFIRTWPSFIFCLCVFVCQYDNFVLTDKRITTKICRTNGHRAGTN